MTKRIVQLSSDRTVRPAAKTEPICPIDFWLDKQERSARPLLLPVGVERLRQAAKACLTCLNGKWPNLDPGWLTPLSDSAHLAAAAQELKRNAHRVSNFKLSNVSLCFPILSLIRSLEVASAFRKETEASASSRVFMESWERTQANIQRAKTLLGVVRAAITFAIQETGVESAIWWKRDGAYELTARLMQGVKKTDKIRHYHPLTGIWKLRANSNPVVYRLAKERSEDAALLSNLEATHGLLIPAYDGRHWVGALSIHSSNQIDNVKSNVLIPLVQRTAYALRALEAEKRTLQEGDRKRISELGIALASTQRLEELLGLVCRTTAEEARADACYLLLAENSDPFKLSAQVVYPERSRGEAEGVAAVDERTLLEIANKTQEQPVGQVLLISRPKLPRPLRKGAHEHGFRSGIGLPLTMRGENLGALILLSKRPRAFTPRVCELLSSYVSQAAVAIENLQLFERTQKRMLEIANLTWVSNKVAATLDVNKIASIMALEIAQALGVPRVALFSLGSDGHCELIPEGQFGCSLGELNVISPGDHLGKESLLSGRAQVIQDALKEERTEDALVKWMGARSLIITPMKAQHGLTGLLLVGDDNLRAFSQHEIALASAYAGQTALALQSALLYRDVKCHLERLAELYEVTQAVTSSLDLKGTLETVLESASALFNAPICAIMMADPTTGELIVKASRGIPPDFAVSLIIRPGEGLSGRAFQSATVLTSTDVLRDGRFKYRETWRSLGLRTCVSAPLIVRNQTLGVLMIGRTSLREFTDTDLQLVAPLANSAAIAIENAHLYERSQKQSEFLKGMMSEINHRIRNTLQAVVGLMRMELDRSEPRSREETIKRCMERLQTVAVIHELMPTREFEFVDIKQVAQRIMQLACQSVGSNCHITTDVTGARVLLPSQKATNVALIFSELVDNALRYGLVGVENAHLSIGLIEAGDEVHIQVTDNGVGFPPGFDLETMSGLGLTVVKGLLEEELGGELELTSKAGGVVVRMRFPRR